MVLNLTLLVTLTLQNVLFTTYKILHTVCCISTQAIFDLESFDRPNEFIFVDLFEQQVQELNANPIPTHELVPPSILTFPESD